MVSKMKDNGFRLEDTDLFGNIYYKHKSFFDNSAKYEENTQNRSWYMKVKEYYNLDYPINSACFTYTKLNRYYIFQKEDNGTNQLESPKYKFNSNKNDDNVKFNSNKKDNNKFNSNKKDNNKFNSKKR